MKQIFSKNRELKLAYHWREHAVAWLPLLIVILIIPASFINLGMFPLLADEPIRGLVSLEMMLNKEYFSTTMSGETYLNKPPLFNWVLIGLSKITGTMDELTIRLGAVLPLLAFMALIFVWFKRHMSVQVAMLTSLAMFTNFRVLLYDLTLGHIDFLFSLVVFLGFLVLYEFGTRRKWYPMFLLLYTLLIPGFLLKGLPAPVFLVFSLAGLAWQLKQFKFLIHPAHFLGVAVFMLAMLGYGFMYSQTNDLSDLLRRFWTESSQRTVLEKSWIDSLLYIPAFPLEYFIHLLPWTLLALAMFRRDFLKVLKQHPFVHFLSIQLVFNVLVYWLSPDTRPRYIFVLFPLVFGLLFYFWFLPQPGFLEKWKRRVNSALFFLIALVTFSHIVGLFFPAYLSEYGLSLFSAGLLLACLAFAYKSLFWHTLVGLNLALVVLRISFNTVVVPYRMNNAPEPLYKQAGVEVGQLTKGANLYVPTYAWIKEIHAFYITKERNAPLIRETEFSGKDGYLLTPKRLAYSKAGDALYEFKIENSPYVLIKLNPADLLMDDRIRISRKYRPGS